MDFSMFRRVTLPLAAFNAVNTASRTLMAIIGPVLAVEFALSASELGLLGACMLAAYGAAQLPGGVVLDRIGARRLQVALGLVTAAGFALFALSDGMPGFVAGRMLIGVGISATLMASIKGNADWFPPARVAAMTGIAVAIGGLGSVLSTAPAQALLPTIGWRGVCWVLCAAAALVAVWIFASVPEKPLAAQPGRASELAVMVSIFRSREFWRLGSAASMLSALNFTYLGLWAGPWLRDVAGYDGAARANTLLAYTLTMMMAALVLGAAASRLKARGRAPFLVTFFCSAGQIAAQVGLALQPADTVAVALLWVLFAFCASGAAPGYVAVGQLFPPQLMGRAATAANALTLVGAFALQAAIGWILDLWPRAAAGGWHPDAYSAALGVSAAIQLLLAAWLFLGGRR